jgi:GGDEF domain-containing protein
MDLDRFNSINDTLGHPIGDKLLKEVAWRVSPDVRASVEACIAADLVGGERFAVDASLIQADANKQRSIPGSEWQKGVHCGSPVSTSCQSSRKACKRQHHVRTDHREGMGLRPGGDTGQERTWREVPVMSCPEHGHRAAQPRRHLVARW